MGDLWDSSEIFCKIRLTYVKTRIQKPGSLKLRVTILNKVATGLIVAISFAAFHRDANACLNSGTGSMILQALLAGIAAVAVTIKMYRVSKK